MCIYNATKQSMSPYAQCQNIPTEFNNYYCVIDPATGKKATTLARLKELTQYDSIEKIDVVEPDEMLVEVCRVLPYELAA